jgi:hypothetical protein
MLFQSASVDTLNMNGTTINGFVNGLPKVANMSNVNIANIGFGAIAYGASSAVTCTNCVLPNIGGFGVSENNVQSEYTMNNGVITAPNNLGPLRWDVPGATVSWGSRYVWQGQFKVLDVTQDANNTYVQTSATGGWPFSGSLTLHVHPAVNFTCTNCTGGADALSLSQAPAGAPLFSYSKYTYAGNFGSAPSFNPWGKLVSMKINVTKPYTGSKPSLFMEALGQFGSFVMNPDGTIVRTDPTINLKVAGERDITPTSVAGLQQGDIVTAPGPISLLGASMRLWDSTAHWPTSARTIRARGHRSRLKSSLTKVRALHRHRHHRAAGHHRNGRSWLYDHFDQPVADRRLHTAAVHERLGRSPVSRIRRDGLGGHRHFGVCLVDLDTDDVRLPPCQRL